MPNRKVVFGTKWFNIESEEFPGIAALKGKPFYRLKCPDSIIILATTSDRKVILIK